MADIRNTGTWQRVERGLSEMANLMSRGEYNFSLVKGRQVMEQIVRLYAGQNFVVYSDLADTIEKLYQGHYIGKESRDSFHTIRMLGNKAVHEGDNDPQDASRAYRLLEREIQNFAGGASEGGREKSAAAQDGRRRADVPAGRTAEGASERPGVPVQKRRSGERGALPGRDRYDRLDDRAQRDREKIPTREDRLRAQKSGKNRGGQNRGQRRPQKQGIELYDILRILIPVICVILLVVLIRSLMGGGKNAPTEAPTTQTETQAVTETEPVTAEPPTEPETTAAAPVRYRIKGNGVNIRYADNENRVYTQLSDGTEIGEVQEIEGSDKVKFTMDGIEVTVSRNFIAPIGETESAAQP